MIWLDCQPCHLWSGLFQVYWAWGCETSLPFPADLPEGNEMPAYAIHSDFYRQALTFRAIQGLLNRTYLILFGIIFVLNSSGKQIGYDPAFHLRLFGDLQYNPKIY
jgi:hypothetical protein